VITAKLPHVFYGGDYNPEQWPEDVWRDDMRLMREAGVNLVSLGIFSWAQLEPRPGQYVFDWLDRVMDMLAENGVLADLATATASPPAWLAKLHPESLPQDAEGRRYYPGGRQHYCPNSVAYKRSAADLTQRLAQQYKAHPALAMWHINNEYGCHISECMCDVCAAQFRLWLGARYKTLEELNERWGTAFWSQHYADWDEILPPRKTPAFCNPAQQLDYKRFMNESLLALCRAEAEILRKTTPKVPVTTNFMGFFKPLDYFQWAQDLDVVSWDSYPDPNGGPDEYTHAACSHDLMRSLKGGQPFVLMEQAPSQVNWRAVNAPKRPGQMRLMSYQALAHGADGIMFFQWRASRAGAEKFHSGMVPHGGKQTRVFREIADLGQELKRLDAVLGARIEAKVALVADWQSRWALELDSKPAHLDAVPHLRYCYDLFYQQNIPVDFVQPEGDWSQYKLVIAPVLYMLTERAAKNIRGYVSSGGCFVMGYFSGIVDENDQIYLGGYPALLKDVMGLSVEEWCPHPQKCVALLPGKSEEIPCSTWVDVVNAKSAQASAVFASGYFAGKPALTINEFGKGKALYAATLLEPSFMSWLMSGFIEQLGIGPALATPRGVEAVVRSKPGRQFLFLLNHNPRPETLDLDSWSGKELLSGKTVQGWLTLEPNGVAIVERKKQGG